MRTAIWSPFGPTTDVSVLSKNPLKIDGRISSISPCDLLCEIEALEPHSQVALRQIISSEYTHHGGARHALINQTTVLIGPLPCAPNSLRQRIGSVMIKNNLKLVYRLIALLLTLSLSACNNGSGSSSNPHRDTPEDTGSISFTIEWIDDSQAPDISGSRALDCTGRDVATIEARLYNGTDTPIAEGVWSCDSHSGVIENIPVPQEEVTLLLVGKNNDRNITYRGEKGGLAIKAGADNQAGAIEVFSFIPPPVTPADTPNTIQWKPVPGAVQYRVEISENEDLTNSVDAISDACTSEVCTYTASGLSPGLDHFVRIYAQDANDNESQSSEMALFKTLALSEVPQNVVATGDLLNITITWESEADGRFNLYWSTTPGVSAKDDEYEGKIEDLDLEAIPYVHENLQGNTTYYYVVTAVNSIGQESDPSAEVSATAVGGASGPENVSATADERKVTLNWTAVAGFHYNIYWSTEPGVSKTEHLGKFEGIDGDSFVHEDCAGTKHYYIVTAENDLGESDPQEEVSAAPGWLELVTDADLVNDESSKAIAVDSDGNSYVIGETFDDFEDQVNKGENDILLMKSRPNGDREWAKLIGTSARDDAHSIGVDAEGNIYIVGTTYGDWDDYEEPHPGQFLFIIKFDTDGERQWITSLAAPGDYDARDSFITVDTSGNCYVTGSIEVTDQVTEITSIDVFIAKYDTSGTQQWIQYLSSPEDETSYAITLNEAGDIFITGETFGDLDGKTNRGGYDIFIAKYSAEGERQWVTLYGDDVGNHGYSIAVNQDHCYVSGRWNWDLHITQLNTDDGVHQWTKIINGPNPEELSNSLALAPNGNLIFAGYTALPEFDGHQNAGEGDYAFDILLMAYDATGERLWSMLFGTPVMDFADGVVIDSDGYAHITGSTDGDLGGHVNSGGRDMFTWKFNIER